ncbi:MAG TPA: hypothetical protein VGO56_09945 [Pyrinomonadaceae bacterium]|jgi:hypothetical protein|nr:hypothetical protein [Pyrinomonadaceae bacterium]
MTQLIQLNPPKSILGTSIITSALVALFLMIASSPTSAQWGASGNNISNTNTGNVGVGPGTPAYALDVQQNTTNNASGTVLRLKGNTSGTNDNTQIRFAGKTNGDLFTIGSDITTNNGSRVFQLYDLVNSAARFTVDPSGNIGVGTTAPGAALDVYRNQNGYTPQLQLNNASNGSNAQTVASFYEGGTYKAKIAANSSGATGFLGGANAFQIWNFSNSPIVFGTNSIERVRFDAGGNVGFGTGSPAEALHIYNTTNNVGAIELQGGGTHAGFLGEWNSGGLFLSTNRNVRTGNNFNSAVPGAQIGLGPSGSGDLAFYTVSSGATGNASELVRMQASGNVGIGTTSPAAKLDVNGNVSITGNLTATGNIAAKYQDVAEWVESSQLLPAGTVVVLDQTKSNQVIASSQAYDTRVAGVISAQPGITLGEKGDTKVLVATTGRVKVKVDASAGPIQVGDLLVTSDIAGVAKKSEPLSLGGVQIHRPGTLIGKALEPLAKGTGEILVLLSLQ